MDSTQVMIILMIGMAVICLLVLALLVNMVKLVKNTKKAVLPEIKESKPITSPVIQAQPVQGSDEGEIVAAITAAIASMLGTTTDRLVVTSFRRIDSKTNWYAR